ncbi:MAG: indole-3-glycerol phosphate synthase TrpC [Acidobacteriota bacterium]
MAVAVPDILARIVDHKRSTLARASGHRADLERRAADRPAARDFRAALVASPPAIISEIKQASPSQGVFTDDFRPASIAKLYQNGGAAALSVLTDEEFFKGNLADLEAARAAVTIPVLRKDFTIDGLDIVEAAAHGADAILLIAAILDVKQLRGFRELAAQYGMAALVEVHDNDELAMALDSGAEIVGVNNRNLHTFQVTLDTSLRLVEKMPAAVLKVAESGIHSREDVRKLQDAGFHAFLVGERLMKSGDAAAALRELRS